MDKVKNAINKALSETAPWSERNKPAYIELKPDLGLRGWNELSKEDKLLIWEYLKRFFPLNDGYNSEEKRLMRRYMKSMVRLNEAYKKNSYARNSLKELSNNAALSDFYKIFHTEKEAVVYEMFSLYLETILEEMEDISYESPSVLEGEKTEDYDIRLNNWVYSKYDSFINIVNDVSEHFYINVCFTRQGIVFKQDQYIVDDVYAPVLDILSNKKWKPVSGELKDAFADYRAGNKEAYSSAITHSIAALEAFLQILNEKPIGKDTLGPLINMSFKNKRIPDDPFTRGIFNNVESVLMQFRKKMGDAHPKIEYAGEKNAKLVLNLVIVFIQHCLQF